MNDQRIVCRPLFRGEEPPHSFAIERVDAKAVDGFRRESDEPSTSKAFRGSGKRSGFRVVRRDTDHIGHETYIVVRAVESVHWAPPCLKPPKSVESSRRAITRHRFRNCDRNCSTVQQELRKAASFPVIVLFAGVDTAGKGETVNLLNEWMDPRWIIDAWLHRTVER